MMKNHGQDLRPIMEIIVKKNVPSKLNDITGSLGILDAYSKQHMKRGFSSTTFEQG
jgi:hypothetical protein